MSEYVLPIANQYPHCDPRVLHSPGQCTYCDRHPDWQQSRVQQRVNFTGQAFEGLSPCPADAARGIGQAHGWTGNRPKIESPCRYCGVSGCPGVVCSGANGQPRIESTETESVWVTAARAAKKRGGFTPPASSWQRFKQWFMFQLCGYTCVICGERVGSYRRQMCQTCSIVEAIKDRR